MVSVGTSNITRRPWDASPTGVEGSASGAGALAFVHRPRLGAGSTGND